MDEKLVRIEQTFANQLRKGLEAASAGILSKSESPVSSFFLLLYDCVGLGMKEVYFELRFNTEKKIGENATRMPAEEAAWNPSFFLRDEVHSPIRVEREFLVELELFYMNEYNLSDDEALRRLWNVTARTVKEWKESESFQTRFPPNLVVSIGNGVGEGAEATIVANGDSLPSSFWEGSMM